MKIKSYFSAIIFVFFGLILSAQSHTWTGNGGDTDWFNPNNWDSGSVPLISSDILIPNGFRVEIINANASANSIEIDGISTLHLENDLYLSSLLTISVDSDLDWFKGTISGGGTIVNNGIIQFETLEEKQLDNFTVDNFAAIKFLNTNINRVSNNTIVNNFVSGTIEIESVGGWTQENIGNTLNNFGIIKKIQNGSGSSIFYLIFDIYNSGTIEVEEEQMLLILGNSIVLDNQESGLLQGSGVFDITANFTNSGTYVPGGQAIGTLEIINYFSFPSEATLEVDIEGAQSGEYDVVEIFGFPELDGAISINLTYAPQIGDEFTIITANEITSCNLSEFVFATYDNITYTFMVDCNTTDVTLRIVESIIGLNDVTSDAIDFYLFPNPFTDKAQFVYSNKMLQDYSNSMIILSDYLGQEIRRIPISPYKSVVDLSKLSSGQYIARIVADNEVLAITKFVVK